MTNTSIKGNDTSKNERRCRTMNLFGNDKDHDDQEDDD